MKKLFTLLAMLLVWTGSSWAQNVSVNSGEGSYPTLKAAFDAINAGTHTGAITIDIVGNTTETASAVLNASGGSANYSSITITPSGSRTISGAITGHLIDLNGADNVTINGLNSGGNSLTISNTATGASSAIRFIADATNNVVTNCTIQGSASTASNGVVFFSTGTTTGNDGNNINNCNIGPAGTNLPINAIFSFGTSAAIDNSGNTLNANNIYDYFNATLLSIGINLGATGNSGWTITNNRLYQTATRTFNPTSAFTLNAINVGIGSGYIITDNTIGFANSGGTGTTNIVGSSSTTPLVITGTFPTSYTYTGNSNATRYIAINCAFTAGGTVSEIQNNTIAGFALFTSSGATTTNGIFCGINITSGNANIGTTTGNTIGATSGTSSIYAANTSGGGTVVGIYATSTNTVIIQNNSIGAIDAVGSTTTFSGAFTGIDVAGAAGVFTISNNIIGNSSADNIRTGYTLSGINLSNSGALTSTTGTTSPMVGVRSTATGATLNITSNTLRGWVNGSTAGGALTGITSTGANTSSVTINNNLIGTADLGWMRYAFANTNSTGILGINLTGSTAATSHSIQSNDFRGIVYSVSGSGSHTYINFTAGTAASNVSTISNNTFTNINVNTTGSVTFISHSYTVAATGTQTINNNSIVTAFNKSGTGGTITLATSSSSSTSGATINHTNNNFSNITVTGATTIAGWISTDGGTANKNYTNNTFSNWTGGTSSITGMSINYGGGAGGNGNLVNGNTISNITSSGAITGIIIGSSGTTSTVSGNTISGLSSTGIAAVIGITSTAPTSGFILKNKIYDLQANNASGAVSGIVVSAGTLHTVANNMIGDLRTPAANAANPLVGVNVSGGSTANIYYNTVYLNGTSSGALFGSSAISASTSPALTLRNNVFINTSTSNGSGLSVAYRRSGSTLSTYATASNNNDFYAPAIMYDGTTAYNLPSYKTLVAPRDAASISENPPFLSTLGSNANFLHIDPTVATGVESGAGTGTGIVDDYDGHFRFDNAGYPGGTPGYPIGGSAPDIGADEFAGTPLSVCSGTPAASTITGVNSVCSGLGTTLALSTNYTDLGITYQWYSGTVSGGPYPNTLGTAPTQATGNLTSDTYYICTITCTNSTEYYTTVEKPVLVNALPTVSVSPTSGSYCTPGGTAVALSASGTATSYAWSPAAGLDVTTGVNVNASPAATTTYTVTGTDGNGCVNTATANITVAEIPSLTGPTATPADVCSNGSSQLFAKVATTSSYSVASNTLTAMNTAGLTPGTYTINPNGDDVVTNSLPIGFSFSFFGSSYTTFQISTNGNIQFGGSASNAWTPAAIPTAAVPNNYIAIAWKDWTNVITSMVNYYTTGNSPNRICIVDFNNPGYFVGQIILHESSNIIDIISTNIPTNTSVQGIENGTGTLGNASTGRNNVSWSSTSVSSFTFTPNGGAPTYLWTPVTFLDDATLSNPLASGMTESKTYSVTGTISGCSATGNVTVNVGASLSASATASPDTPVCAGTPITLTATPTGGGAPFTYSWKVGDTEVSTEQSFIVTPSSSTTYDLTITDDCLQSATDQVIVTIYPTPTAVASSNGPLCEGSTLNLTGTTDLGTTFTWTGPNGFSSTDQNPVIPSATIAASGTYSFTTTLGGCTSPVSTVVVAVNPLPTGVTASASNNNVCAGSAFDLFSTANTANTYTYIDQTANGGFETGSTFASNNWTVLNGPYNNWFVGTTAGVQGGTNAAYAGTDFIGTANSSVNHFYRDIAIPAGVTNINLNFYLKMPVIDNGYDYLNVYTTTTDYTPVVGTLPGAGYTTVLSYTTPALANYTLKSFTLPNSLAGTTVRLVFTYKCDAVAGFGMPAVDNISLTAQITSSVTYSWVSDPAGFTSTDQNPAGVTQTATTEYIVTAENSFGCSASASTTVTNVSGAGIATQPEAAVKCSGETAYFTVVATGPGLSYQWRKGGIDIPVGENATAGTSTLELLNVSSLDAASYDVVVQATCGSPVTSDAAPLTVNTVPTVTVTPTSAIYCSPGGSAVVLEAGGADSYSWLPVNGLDVTTGAIVNANPAATTTYTVTGTTNGCSNTATATITVYPTVTMNSVTATPATICSGSNSILTALATVPITNTYCTTTITGNPGATGDCLNNLFFADITNINSGDAATDYTYYSSLTANLVADGTTIYDISLQAGGASSSFAQQFRIWIDYNQNGIFETSESVFSTTVATYSPTYATGAITIPTAAYNGVTRMRIASKYSSVVAATESCTFNGYGEYEDYNVSITGGTFNPASAAIYSWSPATFLSSNTGSPVTATGVTTTTEYTVTADINGCTASGNVTVNVNPLPLAEAGTYSPVCADAADIVLIGSPEGGVWSGTGVTGNLFDPSEGTQTLTYTYTDVNLCSNSDETTVTVLDVPEVTGVTLLADVGTEPSTWAVPVGGSFTSGFNVCLDPAVINPGFYFLDIDELQSNIPLKQNTLNEFILDQEDLPAGWIDFWENKEVNADAVAGTWEAYMWQIINGNAPIFYIYLNGTDYQLIDGLTYQYANIIAPLRINGDYPAFNYKYTGTVESTDGCISSFFDVFLEVNTLTVPTFSPVAPVCEGGAISALPTTSLNEITGTWAPELNNLVTTTYTFTPTAGLCATEATLTITVLDVPEVTGVTLLADVGTEPSTWAVPVGGSFPSGFNVCLDPAVINPEYYFLDIDELQSNILLKQNTLNEFILDQEDLPAGWIDFWDNKEVNTDAVAGTWEAYMWQIINGNAPIFYIYLNGTDYQLIDGLTYQYANIIAPLRINGDYPAFNYKYSGTVESTDGCISSFFDVFLEVNTLTVPTFSPVAPVCEGGAISALPTTSLNEITGTWAPELNNLVTTTYTFTPTAGLCATEATLTITVLDVPEVTGVTLLADVGTEPSTWAVPVGGSFTSGFNVCLDPAVINPGFYFLDIDELQSNIPLKQNTLNEFILDQEDLPAGWIDFWDNKEVNTDAVAGTWEAYMWQIINGNAPIFYIYLNGTDYQLIDGLTYQYASVIAPLRINGDYPAFNYKYTGTVESTDGCISSFFDVFLEVNTLTVPTFSPVAPVCEGGAISALPTTSLNEITGTWAPELNNLVTTTYTFTPTAGLCATEATLTITILDVPEVTGVTLRADVGTEPSTWAVPVGGSFTSGFNVCLDPAVINPGFYFLDIDELQSNIPLKQNTLNEFILDQEDLPAGWIDFWDNKEVNADAVAGTWEAVMWQIINGNAPIFYIYLNGTDYQLIDGLTYQYANIIAPLRINGDYPAFNYKYTGTVESTDGCISSFFDVFLEVNTLTVPTFSPVAPVCEGGAISALPTTSLNEITGTWAPELNNLVTTTYTFTPTAGLCATEATLTITVLDVPEVTGVTLLADVGTEPSTWAVPVGGSFTSGFNVCLDPAVINPGFYFLDIDELQSNIPLKQNTLNEFILDQEDLPAGWIDFWDNKEVNTDAVAGTWEAVMWQIINGNAPIFYIYLNGTDYQLIDGLTYQYANIIAPLRINGDYPAFNYKYTGTVESTDGCISSFFDVFLEVNTLTVPTFSPVAPVCEGGVISALPTTSLNEITGTWAPELNNLVTTTYTFTPTEGLCATEATLTIVVNTLPLVDAGTYGPVCADAADITLTGTPEGGVWSGIGVTGNLFDPSAGTQTLTYTYTDGNFCVNSDETIIVVNPLPIVSAGSNSPLSVGATLNLTGTADIGTTFSWTGPDGFISDQQNPSIPSVTEAAAGTYSFTATADGCSATASTLVVIIATPTELTITADQTVCNNAAAALSVTSDLIAFDSYIWSPLDNLFIDEDGLITYAGESAITVYAKTSVAGAYTYTCNATNSITLLTDDASATVTVIPASVTITALPSDFCLSGSVTITADPVTGYGTATFQWQQSDDNSVFTDIIDANGLTYTTPTLTSTTYYKLLVKIGATVCMESNVAMVTVNNPQVTETTDGARCGAGTVELAAAVSSGTPTWYAAATGGAPLGTGSPWTTPSITATTNYYVGAEIVSTSNGDVTLGTGTSLTNYYGYPTAFGNYYYQDWQQLVYTAAELNALGLSAGNITGIKFNCGAPATPATVAGYTIRIANTAASVLTGFTTTGLSVVYGPANYTSAAGWNTITFSNPYYWNGTSNLIIDIRGSGAYSSANATTRYTSTTGNTVVYAYSSSNNANFWTSNPTATTSKNRLNVTFSGVIASVCSSPRAAVVATINTPPAITATATPATICSGESSELNVTSDNTGYSYIWTPGDLAGATQTVNPTATTTYTVTATDNSGGDNQGCVASASVAVTVNPMPVVSASASASGVCAGAPFDLYATGISNSPPVNNILVDPAEDGGFETGIAFADNDWTVVNSVRNFWVLDNQAPAYAGSLGAHISLDGATYDYSNAIAGTSHLYRDVVIPAGSTNISLQFYWKGYGESGWDRMLVYTAPTSVTPVVDVPASNSTVLTGAVLVWTQATFPQSTYTQVTVALPNSLAGATVRLIFTWQGDESFGSNPPAAIDNIMLTADVPAPAAYSWTSVPAGFTSTDQNPVGVTQTETTEYIVTAQNSFGCTASASVTVTNVTGAEITEEPVSDTKCAGEDATFTVVAEGSGLTYQWRKGGIDISVLDNPSAVTPILSLENVTETDEAFYDAVVTAGCGDPVYSDVVTLTVNPVPVVSASSDSPICSGETLLLTGSADIGSTFSWTGPNGFTSDLQNPSIPSATVDATGTYTFTVIADGCTSIAATTMVTVNPTPSGVTVNPSTAYATGTPQLLTAGGGEINGAGYSGEGLYYTTSGTPFKGYWGGQKTQNLYLAGDLTAMGLSEGSSITKVSYFIYTFTSPYTFNNFTIAMKNTASSVLTTTLEAGTTTVLDPANTTISGTAPFGLEFTLTTPFVWDGVSNLIIETCFNNANSGGVSGNSAGALCDVLTSNLSTYFSSDNNATLCSNPGAATTSLNRITVGLDYTDPVDITWSPIAHLFTDEEGTIEYNGEPATSVYANPPVTESYTSVIYTATATSNAGCSGEAGTAEFLSGNRTVNLKAYLEGLWNGTTMNQAQDADDDLNTFSKFSGNTADTLSVYLAGISDPWNLLYGVKGVNISTTGDISVEVPVVYTGNYYLVLKHQSSIETWTANPVVFTGGSVAYNFTVSADQAYESNQKDLNGNGTSFGLYAGDVSSSGGLQDGSVDFFDLIDVYNLNVLSDYGYQTADLNGDGFVDFVDLIMVYNNSVNSVSIETPRP
ncbi:MAG: GEVED domain-containing protein [Lentimicrobium sp.]